MRDRGGAGVYSMLCLLGDVIGDRGENSVSSLMSINGMSCTGFSKGTSGLFPNNLCGMSCLTTKYALCVLFLVFSVQKSN